MPGQTKSDGWEGSLKLRRQKFDCVGEEAAARSGRTTTTTTNNDGNKQQRTNGRKRWIGCEKVMRRGKTGPEDVDGHCAIYVSTTLGELLLDGLRWMDPRRRRKLKKPLSQSCGTAKREKERRESKDGQERDAYGKDDEAVERRVIFQMRTDDQDPGSGTGTR
ncbi:hypothetical protein LY76DRAFT_116723 [Colletotrichum caudatum]|nr:hypothetical protein LY76DRAFT_116723 [Colletotrichum caudatum]